MTVIGVYPSKYQLYLFGLLDRALNVTNKKWLKLLSIDYETTAIILLWASKLIIGFRRD